MSGAWQYALHCQYMNNIVHRGVAVPVALEGALEEARDGSNDVGEDKLRSIYIYISLCPLMAPVFGVPPVLGEKV